MKASPKAQRSAEELVRKGAISPKQFDRVAAKEGWV